jgi:hypothetical protein
VQAKTAMAKEIYGDVLFLRGFYPIREISKVSGRSLT